MTVYRYVRLGYLPADQIGGRGYVEPDDLKALAYRNAVEITHARWDTVVRDLIKTLPRPSTIFRRMIIGIILVAVSTLALKQCSPLDGPPQPSERQNSHRAHH